MSYAILPSLLVIFTIVREIVPYKLADFCQSCSLVGETLDGHGDECYVGKWWLLWFVRESRAGEETLRKVGGGRILHMLRNCSHGRRRAFLSGVAIIRVEIRCKAGTGERFGRVGHRVADIYCRGGSARVSVHGGRIRGIARIQRVAGVGMRPLHCSSRHFC